MHSLTSSSNQTAVTMVGEAFRTLTLPPADAAIGIGRLCWGRAEELCTPAYWRSQAWIWELEHPDHFKLGKSLAEEVLACLLGGHGIPAEVGLAAYERFREVLATSPTALHASEYAIQLLSDPLRIGAKQVRYRFARQKGAYVSKALSGLAGIDDCGSDRCLRDALTGLSGIGFKTASWIVRNWRGSDEVAILDVHIIRIARMLRIFPEHWRVERHYPMMEQAYLTFAKSIGAPASVLDSVMWMTMRQISQNTIKSFVAPGYEEPKKSSRWNRSVAQLTAA